MPAIMEKNSSYINTYQRFIYTDKNVSMDMNFMAILSFP